MSMVEVDLARGTRDSPGIDILPMFAVYRADDSPGPAGRWLIARLRAAPEEARHPCGTVV